MVVVSVPHCGVCACHAHARIDTKSCEENAPLDRDSFAPKKNKTKTKKMFVKKRFISSQARVDTYVGDTLEGVNGTWTVFSNRLSKGVVRMMGL